MRVLGLWAVGRLVGGEFDLGGFAMAGVLSFAFGCAIPGADHAVLGVTLSRGTSSAIVGGVLVAMYVMFVVTQISTGLGLARTGLRVEPLPDHAVIDDGLIPLGDLALFVAIALPGRLAALWAFRRRDLAA